MVYGKLSTVTSANGDATLQTVFNALNTDVDYENLNIDFTLVKAYTQRRCKKGATEHEINQQIRKSCDGNTTKIHTVVDGLP